MSSPNTGRGVSGSVLAVPNEPVSGEATTGITIGADAPEYGCDTVRAAPELRGVRQAAATASSAAGTNCGLIPPPIGRTAYPL